VSDPTPIAEARDLIKAGRYDAAVDLLLAAIPDLPVELHRKAYTYTGLAHYFAGRWAEALGYFHAAANGSEVPEDWFNVAMAQVKVGDIEGGHVSWQRVFALSYAHQDASETSTFFQKKLLFAQALRDAGACDARGLDLLERQLLPIFANYHVTDASFWGLRGMPALEEVVGTTLDYYRALGKTRDDWRALLDGVAAGVDQEGKGYCEEMKTRWDSPPTAD
jgi:tetratricopeptide (TPR) repeat protein